MTRKYGRSFLSGENGWLTPPGINGFRLDAVKHIPASFLRGLVRASCARISQGRELFAVGEYWSGSIDEVQKYIGETKGIMRLFDVPLHYQLHNASKMGRDYDLSKVFDNTLVKENPLMAVTFVDNHDSQPGQALQSWVGGLV